LITLPQAAAEKQRRKDEKRAAAAGSDSNDPEKSPTPEDLDVDEKDGQGFDGIMSLRAAAIPKNKDNSIAVKERIPAVPVFPGPSTLRDVVKKADVVLHVVDARDPIGGMSDALAEAAQGKLTVLLNKAGVYDRSAGVQTHWCCRHRAARIARTVARTPTDITYGTAIQSVICFHALRDTV
jgi:nuclear GTP-binding protein